MISMCSLTQSEIANKMGVSQSYVANKIRLLNFSDAAQERIIAAGLSERHARLLLRIKGEDKLYSAIENIRAMHLTVAASEALVDGIILDDMPRKITENSAGDGIRRFEEMLTESVKRLNVCGVKVRKSTVFDKRKRYITICIEQ